MNFIIGYLFKFTISLNTNTIYRLVIHRYIYIYHGREFNSYFKVYYFSFPNSSEVSSGISMK